MSSSRLVLTFLSNGIQILLSQVLVPLLFHKNSLQLQGLHFRSVSSHLILFSKVTDFSPHIHNPPERQEANWFEWHTIKTTLASGMCCLLG